MQENPHQLYVTAYDVAVRYLVSIRRARAALQRLVEQDLAAEYSHRKTGRRGRPPVVYQVESAALDAKLTE